MDILKFLQGLVLVVSLIGGTITIYTYWRNSRLKHAEWLYDLYEKFYEQPQYKKIRRIIDYESKEMAAIRKGIREGGEEELVELLVDYLNFFEFIGSLWKMKQLSLREIKMAFEYYLCRLADFDFLMEFINTQGFENLKELLSQLKSKE